MPFSLRPYQPTDCEPLIQLWHESKKRAFPYVPFQQTLTLAQDRAFFERRVLSRHAIWVAHNDAELAGFFALYEDFINQLFVAIPFWRQGVGTILLNQAKQLSPDGLRLYTFQKNWPARHFYEQHGFRAVKFGLSPAPESEPDVEYRWP